MIELGLTVATGLEVATACSDFCDDIVIELGFTVGFSLTPVMLHGDPTSPLFMMSSVYVGTLLSTGDASYSNLRSIF